MPAQSNVAALPPSQPAAEPASEAVTESIATPMVTPAPQAFVGRPSEPPVAVAVLKAEAQAQVEAQAQGEAQPPPANIAKTDDGKVVSSTTSLNNGNGGMRVALLLPLRSEALRRAAEVVQSGFMASYERGVPGEMSVEVIETGDTAQQVLAAYNAAVADYDIIIGPLSRSGVTAIAQSGKVVRPTIALAQADAVGDAEIELPANMVSIGLSVEAEARQVAMLADADSLGQRALVVSTNIAWQRRAARAFAAQWMRKGGGHVVEHAELGLASGYLNANNVATLLKKIQADRPALVFLALDAAQASQLRESIGTDLPTYGTSQLNPLALPDWTASEGRPLLSGIKLVDMPWQLSADHPAVMIYPRMTVAADQRRSADMERLYALGIDAQRVAHEIVQKRFDFQVDGVTGTLDIDLAERPARFERTESSAIYQDGKVVPAIAP
ncbi:MAG: penicillin-binding protein activator [Janthinobacterium lividum]